VTLRGKAIATFCTLSAVLTVGGFWLAAGSNGLDVRITLVFGMAVAVAAIGLRAFLAQVLAPLTRLQAAMAVAGGAGDGHACGLATSVEITRRTDELGSTAQALDAMLTAMAARDAELRTDQETRNERLRDEFGHQRRAAEEIRIRAQKVVDETVQAVLADLEVVIEQVNEVRTAAGTIDDGVSAASDVARRMVTRASEADIVVSALGKSLHKVDDMARVIASVAAQTNLLALNATIEAVRAGSAGAGFAVVATEVKGLAKTTADSTGDITETISMLERDASAVGDALSGMSTGVTEIDAATAELSAVALRQHAIVNTLAQRIVETKARISDIASASRSLERRGSDRMTVALDADILIGGRQLTVGLTSMSDSGLSAMSPSSINVPADITVKMQLGSRRVEIGARAVRHIDNDNRNIGIAFSTTDPIALRAIHDYLDAVEATRSR